LIVICDKCKADVTLFPFKNVKLCIGYQTVDADVCNPCLASLGVNTAYILDTKPETLKDALFNVFSQIVDERVAEHE
jgi:hypothetical protein